MSDALTMEQVVAELKKHMPLKKEYTAVGDIVLIAAVDPEMLGFAVVTNITRDTSRRDEWYHVEMKVLSVPIQTMTWILRPEQMSGREVFTMGGKPRFVAPLAIERARPGEPSPEKPAKTGSDRTRGARVVPLKVVK